MAGNSFGTAFRMTSWGESHGAATGAVLDGCPAGLEISESDVQKELDRRRPGQSKVTTQRKELDRVTILSGVYEGKTLGTPISMIVFNKDAKSEHYEDLKKIMRPGHADYAYLKKYGIRDHRGGGRSSGRETLARVAVGAIAKKLLETANVKVTGYVKQIGNVKAEATNYEEIEKNPVRCPDRKKASEMEEAIAKAKESGDSLGGVVEVVAKNVPAGLGEPVFDRLDADLAKGLTSIPAIKGFEIGSGFEGTAMTGSEHNDAMSKKGFSSNNAGGVLGGISSGQDVIVRAAVKPPSSISKEQKTVDSEGKDATVQVKGRHDPCICPRVVPVAEAMVSIVLADHYLRSKACKLQTE